MLPGPFSKCPPRPQTLKKHMKPALFCVFRALFKVSAAPPNIEKTYETGSSFMFPGPFGSKWQIRPKTQMPGKWPVHNPNNPSAQPSGCRCTTPQTIFPNSGPCEPLGAGPKRCSIASCRCFAVIKIQLCGACPPGPHDAP